jgi:hypothetical protein
MTTSFLSGQLGFCDYLKASAKDQGGWIGSCVNISYSNFKSNKYFINLSCIFLSNKTIDFVSEILPCLAFLDNNMLYKYIYTLIYFSNYTT